MPRLASPQAPLVWTSGPSGLASFPCSCAPPSSFTGFFSRFLIVARFYRYPLSLWAPPHLLLLRCVELRCVAVTLRLPLDTIPYRLDRACPCRRRWPLASTERETASSKRVCRDKLRHEWNSNRRPTVDIRASASCQMRSSSRLLLLVAQSCLRDTLCTPTGGLEPLD